MLPPLPANSVLLASVALSCFFSPFLSTCSVFSVHLNRLCSSLTPARAPCHFSSVHSYDSHMWMTPSPALPGPWGQMLVGAPTTRMSHKHLRLSNSPPGLPGGISQSLPTFLASHSLSIAMRYSNTGLGTLVIRSEQITSTSLERKQCVSDPWSSSLA